MNKIPETSQADMPKGLWFVLRILKLSKCHLREFPISLSLEFFILCCWPFCSHGHGVGLSAIMHKAQWCLSRRQMTDLSASKLYERLGVSPEGLQAFCVRWRSLSCGESPITELALFGSVLRDDFKADSDIDVLVSLSPECKVSLFGFFDLETQLETLFNRKVDLLEREVVELNDNWIRRKEILNQAQVIYESRRILSS